MHHLGFDSVVHGLKTLPFSLFPCNLTLGFLLELSLVEYRDTQLFPFSSLSRLGDCFLWYANRLVSGVIQISFVTDPSSYRSLASRSPRSNSRFFSLLIFGHWSSEFLCTVGESSLCMLVTTILTRDCLVY